MTVQGIEPYDRIYSSCPRQHSARYSRKICRISVCYGDMIPQMGDKFFQIVVIVIPLTSVTLSLMPDDAFDFVLPHEK